MVTSNAAAPIFAVLKTILPYKPLKLPGVLNPKFLMVKRTLLSPSSGTKTCCEYAVNVSIAHNNIIELFFI